MASSGWGPGPGGAPVTERFELREEVGAGGMGRVYRAIDRTTGATVAVKVLAHERVSERHEARFRREAIILAELGREHRGIVGYVDHGRTHSGAPFLAMEWVDGVTLARRLATRPLGLADAARVAAQAARALGAAHAQGVLHRDVKPSNIMLVGDDPGRVKLVDFGVARYQDQVHALTRTGSTMGTPGYMAPEQARGSDALDGRADLFALGCVLYECLSGHAAFAGTNSGAIQCKILLTEPPALTSLNPATPAALADLVAAMLAKHPDDRPARAELVADALDAMTLPNDVFPPPTATSLLPPTVRTDGAAAGPGATDAAASIACAILAGPIVPGEVLTREQVAALAVAVGVPLERLDDGTLATTVVGEAGGGLERAARVALALRAQAPRLAVALAAAASLHAALDAASGLLTAAAVRAALAGAAPEGIEVAATLASPLAARFTLRPAGRGHLLISERP